MNIPSSISYMNYHRQRLTQRWRFRGHAPQNGGWPVLLGISFPKSGTNLLRQVLAAFARVGPFFDRSFDVFSAFDPQTGAARQPSEGLQFLRALRPGDIAAAHLLAWPEVVPEVRQLRYNTYFIYRDPRDVVVSHVFYVTERATDHVHHDYYARTLKTFDERLMTSILGRPDIEADFPDIRSRFSPYLGWLDLPEVLPTRFEDFILNRRGILEAVIDHFLKRVDIDIDPHALLSLVEANIIPEKSPTFRQGKVGEWRKHFTEEHKATFKAVSGDLLVRLGYESDDQW